MEFFKHSTTAQYSEDLKKIEHTYGVAGLGFYWKTIETLFLGQKPTPMIKLLKDGYKRLSRIEAERILIESGLFQLDDQNMVSLRKGIDYGIDKKSLDNYFAKLTFFSPVPTCAEAHTGRGHCKLDKEKKREENIARETFFIFMEENCRHLLEMAEPLTLAEYRELKKWYTPEQIREVFIDMENDIGLNRRRRNCFQTALSWLRKRFGSPQDGSGKDNGKVFCGLDEYGTPIYKIKSKKKNDTNDTNNQNYTDNGTEDSDSTVCPADAE